LGAEYTIDYRTEDFAAEISKATNGDGVDAVVDFVGGGYLAKNVEVLKAGGAIVQVGLMSGQAEATLPLGVFIQKHLRLLGTVMKSRNIEEKRQMVQRFAQTMLPQFSTGSVRPVIREVYPLADAAEAHRFMENGGGFGKIVLTVS
jgi:NADPH:quinone reductase